MLQQETGNAAVTSTEFVGFLYCSYYYMYNENKIELGGILYNSCTKADYFCSVVCHRPSLSVKGNVCIVCLVLAWTSYKHVKGRKIKKNAWLDSNKKNFKKFQSKLKLEKMDLKLTETRMEVTNCQIFPKVIHLMNEVECL